LSAPSPVSTVSPQPSDLTIRLWRDVLESYGKAYDEARDNWKSLDTKAQGTVAIAGIFIAGIISIFRELSASGFDFNHFVLGFSTLDSALAVGFAASTLWIRKSKLPPSGRDTRDFAREILRHDQTASPLEIEQAFVQEQIAAWDASIASVRTEYNKKASRLLYSQILLLAVVVCVLTVLLKLLLIDT
jgi:hypothetical protein